MSKLLINNSNFPTTIDESLLLFVNNNDNTWQHVYYPGVNENKPLYTSYGVFNETSGTYDPSPQLNYSISGVAEIDSKYLSSQIYYLEQDIGKPINGFNRNLNTPYPNLYDLSRQSYFEIYYFVNNLTEFSSLLGDVFPIGENKFNSPIQLSLNGFISFDYYHFDSYNLQQDLETINQFTTLVQDDLNKKLSGFNSYFNIYFSNSYVLTQAIEKVNSVIFNLLLYNLPILFVTLYLASYSFGLISRSLSRRITIYKVRGLQNTQLLTILILDSILSLLLAIIGSFAVAGFVATTILKTNYILEFNNPENINLVFNSNSLIFFLFFLGLIISFLINFRRILYFVRSEEITF